MKIEVAWGLGPVLSIPGLVPRRSNLVVSSTHVRRARSKGELPSIVGVVLNDNTLVVQE